MSYQNTFKRYELKYMLTRQQQALLMAVMQEHMAPDTYGRTTIRNLYFDTGNYRLIRHSLEKPVYKEKLRLRSYRQIENNEPVFVELKKKYNSVVYKRRVSVPQAQALQWLAGNGAQMPQSQIGAEIDYFLDYYGDLRPVIFLSYERQAWYCLSGSDFRVTFDEHILCRQTGLSLTEDVGGVSILPEGKILMEIKTAGGIPLWMTHFLTEQRIFKTSFSKYGTAYEQLIYPQIKGVFI